MGRSRSRSPQRKERRRSRSKDRDRERRRHHRSRSRSPHRRSPSGSPYRAGSPENDDVVFIGTSKLPAGQKPAGSKRSRRKQKRAAELADDVEMVEIEEDGLNEADMMKMMGFSDFNSTKGKHVPGNDVYVANIVQKRKYRQYMNRRGGFNRPLDFVA